jgi:hypothetical protein
LVVFSSRAIAAFEYNTSSFAISVVKVGVVLAINALGIIRSRSLSISRHDPRTNALEIVD